MPGKPAARIGDMHMCPMVTPGVPPIPHVGGPITGPGCPTVLIGGQPAAVMGDMCTCTGPPDTIALGSAGVMIGGKPAARMGDQCMHGGAIMLGCMTVMIGETGSGGSPGSSSSVDKAEAKETDKKSAPQTKAPAIPASNGLGNIPIPALENVIATPSMPEAVQQQLGQVLSLKAAARDGDMLAHNASTCSICARKN